MNNTIEKIFEAHVRHELNRFKPRAVGLTIREETAALKSASVPGSKILISLRKLHNFCLFKLQKVQKYR